MMAKPAMATEIPASIVTPDTVETRLGTLRFFDGFPDEETVRTVYDNLDFQRAVQAYLAGLPAADTCAQSMSGWLALTSIAAVVFAGWVIVSPSAGRAEAAECSSSRRRRGRGRTMAAADRASARTHG